MSTTLSEYPGIGAPAPAGPVETQDIGTEREADPPSESEYIWKSSFQPDSPQEDQNSMRSAFFDLRTETAQRSIKACERINRASGLTSIGDELLALLACRSDTSIAVFDDPVFTVWLRFLHRAEAKGQTEEMLHHSSKLPEVLARVERRLTRSERWYVQGSTISVHQDDIDPYIMAATVPTYDFTKPSIAPGDPKSPGHPVGLQAELLGITLREIGQTWPEMKEQVLDYVKVFGYLPEADFRSCSAARYSGVVYLGNMDESVLDLEESVVHETGHQVLYRLAELSPLTKPNTPQDASYVLPWSGSKRDLFGFLHAFYIYALLTKYFWRRAARGGHEADDSRQRAQLILLGLMMARPTLRSDPNLTEQGHLIVEQLCDDIGKLRYAVFGVERN
jgi:hypothetical protein